MVTALWLVFPLEITTESNSEGNRSPVMKDVYYGRVVWHRTWCSRRHGGHRPPYGMCCNSVFYQSTVRQKSKKMSWASFWNAWGWNAGLPRWRLALRLKGCTLVIRQLPMIVKCSLPAQRMFFPVLPCNEMPAKPFPFLLNFRLLLWLCMI